MFPGCPKVGELFKEEGCDALYFCLTEPYRSHKWNSMYDWVFKAYAFHLGEVRDLVAEYKHFVVISKEKTDATRQI